MRSMYLCGLIIFGSALAVCQKSAFPTFDVASVRPSSGGRQAIEATPSGLSVRNTRLSGCISWAYDVQDYQVSGPSWLNEARFDIVAKAAAAAPPAQVRAMLRELLAERFHLELHHQTKEMTALVMTVAKGGHKLKAVETEGSPSFTTGKMNLTGRGATIAQLTTFLSNELRMPVIDETGLTGRFDYFLDINAFVTDEIRKNMPSDGPPIEAGGIIATAVKEQLGLKVDSRKSPVDVLVIDRIERTPAEN